MPINSRKWESFCHLLASLEGDPVTPSTLNKDNGEFYIQSTLEDYAHIVASGRCRDGESPGLGVRGPVLSQLSSHFSLLAGESHWTTLDLSFLICKLLGLGEIVFRVLFCSLVCIL